MLIVLSIFEDFGYFICPQTGIGLTNRDRVKFICPFYGEYFKLCFLYPGTNRVRRGYVPGYKHENVPHEQGTLVPGYKSRESPYINGF